MLLDRISCSVEGTQSVCVSEKPKVFRRFYGFGSCFDSMCYLGTIRRRGCGKKSISSDCNSLATTSNRISFCFFRDVFDDPHKNTFPIGPREMRVGLPRMGKVQTIVVTRH